MTRGTKAMLAARGRTHGDFAQCCELAQATKALWREAPNWPALSPAQCEALEQIATKIARMLCGDHRHRDHMRDIAGYAELIGD